MVGLAGVAGVAATGAVVARAERRRRAYAPEDVRARLHERIGETAERSHEETATAQAGPAAADGDDDGYGRRVAAARSRSARTLVQLRAVAARAVPGVARRRSTGVSGESSGETP